ncbi:cytochrome P450 (plasmid) [Streptomyces sp. NBC_00015]|uniref:cytochrome P450 n=1 Tax=Streptomyces sp. NBC_00015 TaxID=2903611 RepID=UPI002F919C11
MPINLADPDLYATTGGLEELRHLQVNEPVYWNALAADDGFWALTRYADAVAVYRNPKAFTSEQGIQVGQSMAAARPAAGKMLVLSDRGTHRRIKSILSRYLAPGALARHLLELRAEANSTAERVATGEPFDFVTDAAGHLTLTLLGSLLGIPAADRDQVSRWTGTAFGSTTGPSDHRVTGADSAAANAQLFVYFGDLLARRRREASDDLLSALVLSGASDGQHLTDEEILFNVHLLLAGGHETTRQALTGIAAAFIDSPDEWDRLRAQPQFRPTAVEEILRWSAPSLNVMRTATQEIEIGGTLIRVGQRVTMWHPIVNRDEDFFHEALRFDIARDPNRHLSFGMGSHFCLGAWLAREELQVLIEALTSRVRRIEPAGAPRRSRSNRTWGYDYLPVRLCA